jgi:hypothetical protein
MIIQDKAPLKFCFLILRKLLSIQKWCDQRIQLILALPVQLPLDKLRLAQAIITRLSSLQQLQRLENIRIENLIAFEEHLKRILNHFHIDYSKFKNHVISVVWGELLMLSDHSVGKTCVKEDLYGFALRIYQVFIICFDDFSLKLPSWLMIAIYLLRLSI